VRLLTVALERAFGKPTLTHAYLPDAARARILFLCLLAGVARATGLLSSELSWVVNASLNEM